MNAVGFQAQVAVLTSRGLGAVATCLVAGPQARECVNRCFHPSRGTPLGKSDRGRVLHGRWRSGEELIVCQLEEERVEVHCHGGEAALETVVSELVQAGAHHVDAQQLLLALAPDRLTHELDQLLVRAPTPRVAGLILIQRSGTLAGELARIADQLNAGAVQESTAALASLRLYCPLARHLVSPWRICLAGPPNVGKSSLMNEIVGFQRSLVDSQAGTTRDRLSATTSLDGWPVTLLDTAGIEESRGTLERAGQQRTAQSLQDADLVLLVEDASLPTGQELPDLPDHQACVRVHNKWDLVQSAAAERPPQDAAQPVRVSAKHGWGIKHLIERTVEQLIPRPLVLERPIPCGTRLADDLDLAARLLQDGELTEAATLISKWLSSVR